MATNGLVVMPPTSVSSTGSGNSSSINADGSVDFASCSTIALNGVFNSNYDNYMVTTSITLDSLPSEQLAIRMRSSGMDSNSSTYYFQNLTANGTSVTAGRSTSTSTGFLGNIAQSYASGFTIFMFRPWVSEPSLWRTVSSSSSSAPFIRDSANLQPVVASYDGFNILAGNGYLFSGKITVFGFNQ